MKAIVNVNKNWAIGKEGNLLINIPEDMRYFRAQTKASTVIMGRKTLLNFPGRKPLKGRLNLVLTRDSSRIPSEAIKAADNYYDLSANTQDEFLSPCVKTVCRSLRHPSANTRNECSLPAPARSFKNGFFIVAKNNLKFLRECDPGTKSETILVVLSSLNNLLGIVKSIEDGSAYPEVFVIGGASIYNLLLEYCDTCLVTMNDCPIKGDSFFPDLSSNPNWKLTKKGKPREYDGVHFSFDTWQNTASPAMHLTHE